MPDIATGEITAHGRKSAWADVQVRSPSGGEVTTRPSRVPIAAWPSGSVEGLYDVVGERTRQIIEYRRRGAGTRRRGWLIRRALVGADVVGLGVGFLPAELLFSARAQGDPVQPWLEGLGFV